MICVQSGAELLDDERFFRSVDSWVAFLIAQTT